MAAPKIALRRIKDLTPDPRNARTHSVEQTATLVGLINRFGWTNPILADDLIRAGHGRLLAAQAIYAEGGRIHMAPGKERGGSILPADTVPVIDCSGWTEDERKAYSLADNQIALQAGWDDELLSAQLEELIAADFDITDIGFDPEALSDLAAGGGDGGGLTELQDSNFTHTDQFAVIVRCVDEAEQEARFNRLRDEFGAENVKVVVV